MTQVDECCMVCADPLEWCGFGPCGHNEICSRCVARLRFVLKDKRCVLCQQEIEQMFITRYMGDYTARVTAEQFGQLQVRAAQGELHHCKDIDSYFDDKQHHNEITSLLGYTHPVLQEKSAPGSVPTFNTFAALKKHLETQYKLQFCDICLAGRKVFISEQILYTRQQLDRHHRTGDETGPLAESSFKGHPNCKFCHQRYFDSSELYKHMEGTHEHCFLCRRAHPDKYIYYRNYRELEGHFQSDHHLCPHPNCLEKGFVVFSTEAELRRHTATEHGDELKMSRAQRREALTIPLQFNYRSARDGPEDSGGGDDHALQRPGTVIGGGDNVRSRHGMRHSRSEGQVAAALQASRETFAAESSSREAASDTEGPGVGSVTFNAQDFPTVSGQGQTEAVGRYGHWAAFASHAGGSLHPEQFPALPTLSKSAKKKLKEDEKKRKTLVEQLRAAAAPVRVINRGGASSSSSGAAAASSSSMQPQLPPGADDFPSLPSSSKAVASGSSRSSSNSTVAARLVAAGSSTSSSSMAVARPGPALMAASPSAPSAKLAAEDFPSLPGSSKAAKPPPPTIFQPPPASAPAPVSASQQILNSLFLRSAAPVASSSMAPSTSPVKEHPSQQSQQPPSPSADFPSLPSKPPKAGKGAAKQLSPQKEAAPEQPAQEVSAVPRVSETLKQANRVLIEKIKRQLSNERFETFRSQSLMFMSGAVTAQEYHDLMVQLGLLSLAPELASLCPEDDRREELMAAHIAFLTSPMAQDPKLCGKSWVPPEAALANATKVQQNSAWSCGACLLINAPSAAKCEACSLTKSKAVQLWESKLAAQVAKGPSSSAQQDFPALGSGSAPRAAIASASTSAPALTSASAMADVNGDGDGDAGPSAAGSKGKKGKAKQTIRIGLHTGTAAQQPAAPAAPPQNAWGVPAAAQPRGQWSGAGGNRIAKTHGALNDAWKKG